MSATQTNQLILDGCKVRVDFPVVNFKQPGSMSFYGLGGWAPRKKHAPIDLIVLHWDGCTSSRQCFKTLRDRKLSVHFMVDGDGTVFQALDPADAIAWHAKGVNHRSIGIEIQNPVLPEKDERGRQRVTERRPHSGPLHTHLDFTRKQKQTVVQLVKQLCEFFDIPTTLPMDSDSVVTSRLADIDFKGVSGHYHFATNKVDPGMTLWPLFQKPLERFPHAAEA